jgi:hypothetical protein
MTTIAETTAQLEVQLDLCHAAATRLFERALKLLEPCNVPYDTMTLAARLMQANAQTALALQKLKTPGTHHTVTVRAPKAGRGKIPTPEIQKTNGAA